MFAVQVVVFLVLMLGVAFFAHALHLPASCIGVAAIVLIGLGALAKK